MHILCVSLLGKLVSPSRRGDKVLKEKALVMEALISGPLSSPTSIFTTRPERISANRSGKYSFSQVTLICLVTLQVHEALIVFVSFRTLFNLHSTTEPLSSYNFSIQQLTFSHVIVSHSGSFETQRKCLQRYLSSKSMPSSSAAFRARSIMAAR